MSVSKEDKTELFDVYIYHVVHDKERWTSIEAAYVINLQSFFVSVVNNVNFFNTV